MDIEIENVNSLLEFAKDWYRSKPGTQMPLDVWAEQVDTIIEKDITWGVYDSDQGIERVKECLIPAFAALSLGLSTEALHDILLHHRARAIDLCECYFVTLHDAKGRASSSTFSSWHATQALVKAFCLKKEFTADFLEKSDTIYRSPEFRISLLTVQDPDLWPITTMREHVRLGKEGALDSEHESMEPTTINNFRSDHVDFELFSDKQILALLNRSGNLCLEATCEYGFYANFFHGLFRSADTSKNLRRIIQVINDLEDPALVEKIRLRIAENMANSATDSQKEGVFALQGMQLLDQSKYGSILQSFVMTLCVLPAGIIEDASEYDHPSSPAFLNDYCKTPEKALLRLQEELMATPVEDFRIQHFNALGRFSSKWRHEQDFTGVDLQGLLIHCLEAFQVYSHTVHITLASMVTTDMADETREYMESLIGYAMKHIEPDYQRFEHLSQNTQVMLANGGMEVRKLPGLSRTDRGKILVDQLGL